MHALALTLIALPATAQSGDNEWTDYDEHNCAEGNCDLDHGTDLADVFLAAQGLDDDLIPEHAFTDGSDFEGAEDAFEDRVQTMSREETAQVDLDTLSSALFDFEGDEPEAIFGSHRAYDGDPSEWMGDYAA